MPERRIPGWALPAFFFALLLAAHTVSIFTENINWDEFSLLARAADTWATGELRSGGRPGLGTLILIPFVRDCSDAISAVRGARLLWMVFTVGLVAGFWLLLSRTLGEAANASRDVALGVALLVLVPAFLRFSLQVRTDQPAIAFGLWAGVALLASRRTTWWAAVSGLLFGIGFLFSQKLAYVFGLTVTIAAGDLWLRREFLFRREAVRILLCAIAGITVWFLYAEIVGIFFEQPGLHVSGGLATLDYYRETFGFKYYYYMLPTLIPHLLLIALLATTTARHLLGQGDFSGNGRLWLSWAILGAGVTVLLFHTGAFPYFWMTLGLFPATVGAISFGPILSRYRRQRDRRFVIGSLWVFLALQTIIASGRLLEDTQTEQRESLAFIERHFSASAHGFFPERGLFCRPPNTQFSTPYFKQTIAQHFSGPDSSQQIQDFIEEFRSRPVSFLVGSSWRHAAFPDPIRSFWERHYLRYYRSVYIPAPALAGAVGTTRELDILVSGRYRIASAGLTAGSLLRIDDQALENGEEVRLARGKHRIDFLADVSEARLVLSIAESGRPRERPFYRMHPEITGVLGLW